MMLSDFHMMLPLVTNLKEGDIFVAISTSGRTRDVLEMAQYAKRGATVIGITKPDQSSPYIKKRHSSLYARCRTRSSYCKYCVENDATEYD